MLILNSSYDRCTQYLGGLVVGTKFILGKLGGGGGGGVDQGC